MNLSQPMTKFMRTGLLSIAAFVCGLCFVSNSTSYAAEADIGKQVATIEVPKGLTQAAVKEIVLKALTQRKWQLKDKTDSSAVGYYVNGSNEATVTVKFDTQQIQIFCVGHTKKKDELPMRWIDNLKKDMSTFLNRAFAKS